MRGRPIIGMAGISYALKPGPLAADGTGLGRGAPDAGDVGGEAALTGDQDRRRVVLGRDRGRSLGSYGDGDERSLRLDLLSHGS